MQKMQILHVFQKFKMAAPIVSKNLGLNFFLNEI